MPRGGRLGDDAEAAGRGERGDEEVDHEGVPSGLVVGTKAMLARGGAAHIGRMEPIGAADPLRARRDSLTRRAAAGAGGTGRRRGGRRAAPTRRRGPAAARRRPRSAGTGRRRRRRPSSDAAATGRPSTSAMTTGPAGAAAESRWASLRTIRSSASVAAARMAMVLEVLMDSMVALRGGVAHRASGAGSAPDPLRGAGRRSVVLRTPRRLHSRTIADRAGASN